MTRILDSLRSRAGLPIAFLVALLLAACAPSGDGDGDGGSPNTGGGTVAVSGGQVTLSANDLVFDASTIQAPAGEAFTITLRNLASQPPNVAVYRQEGGEEIVIGEVVTGPDVSVDTEVPALEPGTYYFRCDVHPDMEGTIVVEG
jgi:plastocyanin